MFGNATIEVYDSEAAPVRSKGLSDVLALSFGRIFAQVLPDEQSCVIVTLGSGEIKVMGLCTFTDTIHIGRLISR